ncbi:MAG: tetratricopeptide repeat protein, partial [Ginsengibacter sp.]
VNVASRIQSLGQANTILFSKEICDKIRNQPEFKSVSLGVFEFKNVDEPIEVFALSNEGLIVPRRENMEGKMKEIKKRSTQRKWIIVTIAILLLLSGALFIYKSFTRSKGFAEGEKSIAVLPFDGIGLADADAYLSDGITEDIINNLSKISSLQKVIGWFSVKNFRKTTKSAKQIADELGVTAILTGTIQNENGNIHIIAELDDVSTNLRLWGEDYTYNSKDVLSIQSTVASKIATALKANLTPEEKRNLTKKYTENVEAYKFYIRGRTFWNTRGKANFDSAEDNFKKAISLDPNYALAHAGIADCYTFNLKGIPQLEAVPFARAEANRALSIDSNLSEGLTALGFIQFSFDYEWSQAKTTLQKALDLDPNNSTAHLYYGMTLQYTGDVEKGLKEQEKAVELDPLAFSANWVLGRNYYFAGKYDEAIKQIDKAETLAPKNSNVCIWSLGLVYLGKKMYQEALA